MLRISEVFPVEWLVETAEKIDADRAESLSFRFYHENLLIDKATEKFWFGWGGWGRNRLEDSVTDGFWIIIFGQYGVIGLWSFLLLMLWQVMSFLKKSKSIIHAREKTLMTGYGLVISILMINQLPNSSMKAYVLFFIGAFSGSVIYLKESKMNNKPNASSINS